MSKSLLGRNQTSFLAATTHSTNPTELLSEKRKKKDLIIITVLVTLWYFLDSASSSRLTERSKTLGEWFPLCHWALQCAAEQTQALLETINWVQSRLWAKPCSVQGCRGIHSPRRAVDAGGNEAGSGSLWVSDIEHCLPGGSGTQHHDPQGIFNPQRFQDCPLLPSCLESEGLYKVILSITTAPEHQCSLPITHSASRFSSIPLPK